MNIPNEVFFVNSEQPPVKTEHVCWYTREFGEQIDLIEVVKEFYPHPQAPNDAIIFRMNDHLRFRVGQTNIDAQFLLLMQQQQKVTDRMFKLLKQDGRIQDSVSSL